MKNKKLLIIILAVAILIKLSLFIFGSIRVPESKFDSDSADYLNTAAMLYSDRAFATRDTGGLLKYHVLRTPGYPLFIAVVHNLMKVPLSGVVFLQLLLTILVGLIVYKIAMQIDHRIAILSAIIMLYDLPTTVFSLRIMTEALFLLILPIFIYMFIRYLKTGKLKVLLASSLVLVLATYVRPISYYLGIAIAVFIVYANASKNIKAAFTHALIFLVIVYSLLGMWQIRNYMRCQEKSFTSIASSNFKYYGLIKEIKDYKGNSIASKVKPILNFTYESWRSFLSLMTRPGTLKYFKSKPLAIAGKVLGYPWMVLWMIGFLAGILRMRRNILYQFLLFIILYFVGVAVFNLSFAVSERFRVPVVPCIAIISAYGWIIIVSRFRKINSAL